MAITEPCCEKKDHAKVYKSCYAQWNVSNNTRKNSSTATDHKVSYFPVAELSQFNSYDTQMARPLSSEMLFSQNDNEALTQQNNAHYRFVPIQDHFTDFVEFGNTTDHINIHMGITETASYPPQMQCDSVITNKKLERNIRHLPVHPATLSIDSGSTFSSTMLTVNQSSPELNICPMFQTFHPTSLDVEPPVFTYPSSSSNFLTPTSYASWPLMMTTHNHSTGNANYQQSSVCTFVPSSSNNNLPNFYPYFQCTAVRNIPMPTTAPAVQSIDLNTPDNETNILLSVPDLYDGAPTHSDLTQQTTVQAIAHDDNNVLHIPELSGFLDTSVSDIPLDGLEELLARTSVNDIYIGPAHGRDGKLMLLDPSLRDISEIVDQELPYSSSSLAFAPPGVLMVTEMWPSFVEDRLSHCNHRIHTMDLDSLRRCLYDHGLNQRGSPSVLRRRLQEFLRRVRNAQCSGVCRLNIPTRYADDYHSDTENISSTAVDSGKGDVSLSQVESNIPTPPLASPTPSLDLLPGRRVSLPKPVVLTSDTFYTYLLIIDLEATCDYQDKSVSNIEYLHEIIEFPVLLYSTRSRRCVSVFHAYCQPKLNPDLTTFCTNLTQISQLQVDNSYPFPYVLKKVEHWLLKKHKLSDVRCAIVCDCSADMSKFMRIQCHLNNMPMPPWANVWINLSKAFRMFYKIPSRYRVTLKTMLQDLNLAFVGQHHRGLDDAINILRVVRVLLTDGCLLRVNERIDLGKSGAFVTSVPRLVAEATSGVMGSRLVLLSRKSRSNNGIVATGKDNENPFKNGTMPDDIPEDHRQSLLWLANVQKTRVSRG